jgi:hypothetical protein
MNARRKPDQLDVFDAITLDLISLRGTLGVCRIAAAAQGEGTVGGHVLADADLPDALDGAERMVESLKERIEQLCDSMKSRSGTTAATGGAARAADVSGFIDSAHSSLATIDGLAFRILERCRGEDNERAALADAIGTVAAKASGELQSALDELCKR